MRRREGGQLKGSTKSVASSSFVDSTESRVVDTVKGASYTARRREVVSRLVYGLPTAALRAFSKSVKWDHKTLREENSKLVRSQCKVI
jgi:hypothetical protein